MFAIETIFELCSCIAIQTTKFGHNILVKKILSVFPKIRDPGSTTWRFPFNRQGSNISSLLGLRSVNITIRSTEKQLKGSQELPCA